MISIAMLGGGAAAATYYLERAADCEPGYYTAEQEAPGRWCGLGARALGLTGPITGEQAEVFARLLDGCLPDDTRVMSPVLRGDPRGKLPAAVLVGELQRAASDAGVEISGLFTDPKLASTAVQLVDRQHRAGDGDVLVSARTVADVAVGAGLNVHLLHPGIDTALSHAGDRVDIRRSGLDLAVSAPKSVSVLFALTDPAISSAVVAAHERAVDEALGYLDRHTAHAIRGHHGGDTPTTRVGTDGLAAAAFTHHSSRADDPQLHTHLVIANLLRGEDGKSSAVDSRAVHRHARTAGCIYQATLRGELTATLGVQWGPVRKGVAEITGIPHDLQREFSTRRRQIETELDRTGASSRKAAQRAAYRTRAVKTHTPELSLRERWLARTYALGHDTRAIIRSALNRTRSPELPAVEVVAGQLFGPTGLTAKATSFDRRDVIQTLTETLPTGVTITGRQLEAAAGWMLGQPDAIRLLHPRDSDTDEPRWSSRELLATEDLVLGYADLRTTVPPRDPDSAAEFVADSRLTPEQQQLVIGLMTSPDLIDVVVGPAGSGKTAALRLAAHGWADQHVPVVGCAVAAITARRLEAATAVPSTSIARLLTDVARIDPVTGRPVGLAPRSVVLVDEASMVDTRSIAHLAAHVVAAEGKLVLVGDPAQLPEIGAGGIFAALANRPRVHALTVNVRQQQPWERAALTQLRAGDIPPAIDAYLTHRRVHIGTTISHTRQLLAEAYTNTRAISMSPYDVVALASTRRDVTDLNTTIRHRLRGSGRLGPDVVSVPALDPDEPTRSYAVGDLVIVTGNDHHRGLLNGTRGTLTHVTSVQMSLRTESGLDVTVPTGWAAEHLDHGYAITVHKAQGLTAETALLYGASTLCQQAGYVALSRGRTDNHLLTSHPSLTGRADIDIDRPAFQLLSRAEPDAVLDHLTGRLSRARTHTLARDQEPDEAFRAMNRIIEANRHREHERYLGRNRGDDFGLSL